MTSIRLEGAERLKRKLAAVEKGARVGLKAAALHVQGELKNTKPSASGAHRPQGFKTDRQRRGFFARLRSGQIQVPYRRRMSPGSQDLTHSWTQRAEQRGMRQVIGTNVSYARFVQGPNRQTNYHRRTGWKTSAQILQAERALIEGSVAQIIEREIGRA